MAFFPMKSFLTAIATLVVGGILYFFKRLVEVRREMANFPTPPSSFWLGNIPIAAECQQHFPPDLHPHAWCHYIKKKYNLGKFFYMDLWPLGPRWLFITDPELASHYVTTGTSLPKSKLVIQFLQKLLGDNNMVSVDGPQWKKLRTMFNPGFSTAHLMTLVPYMVDASVTFCEVLREKAKAEEVFEMEEYATRLTIDIIGKVVLDANFNAQRTNNPIVDTFRYHITLMPASTMVNPLANFNPFRLIQIYLNQRKLDRLIGEEIDKRYATTHLHSNGHAANGAPKSKADRKRSVVDLALQTYQEEYATPTQNSKPATKLDPTFRKDAIDQLKTFIFAGHDTTSSTIAYAFYLLHNSPTAHAAVVAELDAVLSTDLAAAPALLKSQPHLVNSLPYCTAVMKETLRLFPPASTLRYCPENSDFALIDPDNPGTSYPLRGCDIWPVSHAIHRNETYFPSPLEFIPERFLPSTPFPDAPVHKDAWRPFEKGPRNCIGQELAVLESKVIFALTLREFDFEVRFPEVVGEEGLVFGSGGDGGVRVETVGERGRVAVEGHRCIQILKGSAKPKGGMPGVVRSRTAT